MRAALSVENHVTYEKNEWIVNSIFPGFHFPGTAIFISGSLVKESKMDEALILVDLKSPH